MRKVSYVELRESDIKRFMAKCFDVSEDAMPGVTSGIMMVFMPTISTFAIAELLTMNNIKLFGTTIQENINNGMWNYGAALSLIMLVIIGITSLFSDSEEQSQNEGGII